MADHCNICDTRRPEGTNILLLNGGTFWVEFCPRCAGTPMTNQETLEVKAVGEIFVSNCDDPILCAKIMQDVASYVPPPYSLFDDDEGPDEWDREYMAWREEQAAEDFGIPIDLLDAEDLILRAFGQREPLYTRRVSLPFYNL